MIGQDVTNLLTLAKQVQSLTSAIVTHLEANDHPLPDFSTASVPVPSQDAKYDDLRNSLNDAAKDLLYLVNGPGLRIREEACRLHDLAAYQVAFHFDFFNTIPEDAPMHLATLSEKTGVDADRAGRILRLLCTLRMFEEVEKDLFAHTSYSINFARDEYLKAAGDHMFDEVFKADSDCSLSIKEGKRTPFEQRFGMTNFEYYAVHPELAARFARSMTGIKRLDRQTTELKTGFPWSSLGNAKVVDIGGGSGHISVDLARDFTNLNITVQDLNLDMLNTASAQDLSGAEGRMTFMQYDFFKPQPVADADVYFLRQILHNWDDDSCVKILKNVAVVLEKRKPGTPLLINETMQPKSGTVSRHAEYLTRQIDMMMMVAFGAKQRTAADVGALLKRADPRFKIVKVQSEGSMGLLEVHLEARE